MWTCLTHPFTYALPGFDTSEIDPWQENGERWRRLRVTWPDKPVGHSKVQTVYVGDDGLIRRFDYEVEIANGPPAAHYLAGYAEVAGIMVPISHTIVTRDENNNTAFDPVLVSITLDQVAFSQS